MKRKQYEDFIRCFKSRRHIRYIQRRLGKELLNISVLIKIQLHKDIEAMLNKGSTVRYIVNKLEASKSTVYRLRKRLWKRKK